MPSPDLPVSADLETTAVVLASMGEGVVLHHADGRLGLVNDAAMRMLGMSAEQLSAGRASFDPEWRAVGEDGEEFPVDDRPTVRVLRTGEPVSDVVMGIDVPGADRRWVSVSCTPVGEPGPDGLPTAVLATFADITERWNAERALVAERDFSIAVTESVSDMLVVAEVPSGRILSVNGRLLDVLGYSRDEVVGAMPPWPFWPPELLDQISVTARAAFESPTTDGMMDHDREVVSRDGERIPVIVSGAPILDASGTAVALVVTYKDVRDRHAAAESLRRSEERFRLIAENTGDAIGLFTPAGECLYYSPAGIRIFGHDERVLDESDVQFPRVNPDDRQSVIDAHTRVASGEADVVLQFRYQRPDGRMIWVETTGNPVRGADGRVTEVVVSARDVTERVTREAEEKALRRVTEAVARGARPEETLTRIAEEAGRLLAADYAGVIRYDEIPSVVGHWSRRDPTDPAASLAVPSGPSSTDLVWHRDRVDVAHFGVRVGQDAGAFLREGVVAPVTLGGRLWGCLSLIREHGDARGFGPGAEARLARFAELATLALEVATSRERLVEQARTDPLTGLPHSIVFHERLAQEVARALRHGLPLTLITIDIDRLREVNDRHGHAAGDRALAAVGAALAEEARGHDIVARVGGEEFAVVLTETDLPHAADVCARMLRAIADATAGIVPLTASAGVAALEEGDEPGTLLRRADHALRRAKTAGGGLHHTAPTRRERRLRPARPSAAR